MSSGYMKEQIANPKSFLDDYFELYPDNEIKLNSVSEIFTFLHDSFSLGHELQFRGVSNIEYGLTPAIDRGHLNHFERDLLSEFSRSLHNYVEQKDYPSNLLELMSLMQHHGGPTRLLDFSRSPYVALYFAVRDSVMKKHSSDGALFALAPHNLHAYTISSLRNRKEPLVDSFHNLFEQIALKDGLFQKMIWDTKGHDAAFFIEPRKTNKRSDPQQGVFLIANKPLNNVLTNFFIKENKKEDTDDPTIMRIRIQGNLKEDILDELNRMNINAFSLFPDIDGLNRAVLEKIALNNSRSWRRMDYYKRNSI